MFVQIHRGTLPLGVETDMLYALIFLQRYIRGQPRSPPLQQTDGTETLTSRPLHTSVPTFGSFFLEVVPRKFLNVTSSMVILDCETISHNVHRHAKQL